MKAARFRFAAGRQARASAVVGLGLSVCLGLTLGLAAARNIAPNWVVWPVRRVMDLLRSIPDLVIATLFIVAVGLGPLAGVLAFVDPGDAKGAAAALAGGEAELDRSEDLAIRFPGWAEVISRLHRRAAGLDAAALVPIRITQPPGAPRIDTTDELDAMIAKGRAAGTEYPFVVGLDPQASDPYHLYPFQTSFGSTVFAQNDDMGLGAIEAIEAAGKRPETIRTRSQSGRYCTAPGSS